jgi:hypothetical protein
MVERLGKRTPLLGRIQCSGVMGMRLLTAHRDQSSSGFRGWFPGYRTVPPDPATPSQAFRPVDSRRTLVLLPLRGQRRFLAGFPIIPPVHETVGHLNCCDKNTAIAASQHYLRHRDGVQKK